MDQRKNGAQRPDSSSTEEQSIQEMMELGNQASHLLGNPVYNVVYQLQLRNMFNQWLESSPKEVNKREGLYQEAQGLIAMTRQMGALVDEANRILVEQEKEHDPRRQHDEYLNNQGFGLN